MSSLTGFTCSLPLGFCVEMHNCTIVSKDCCELCCNVQQSLVKDQGVRLVHSQEPERRQNGTWSPGGLLQDVR